jgi:hypothetical protein
MCPHTTIYVSLILLYRCQTLAQGKEEVGGQGGEGAGGGVAKGVHRPLLMLNSFNEWHEGTVKLCFFSVSFCFFSVEAL